LNNKNKYHRRSIRLKEYDYSSPGEYFVTICAFQRKCIFGNIINESVHLSHAGEIIKRYWEGIPKHYENVALDEFIVMPNHIHGIIVLTEPVGANSNPPNKINLVGAIHESPLQTIRQRRNMKLSKIIGRFKMTSSKEINLMCQTQGIPVWQRNYYEHIIRDEKDFENTRDYIIHNPLKWFCDNDNLQNLPL